MLIHIILFEGGGWFNTIDMYNYVIFVCRVTKGTFRRDFISKKIRFYKAVPNFLNKNLFINLLINTLTYIYTSKYQIKQSVFLSYVCIVECNRM